MKSLFYSPAHKAFEAKLETTREAAIYSWITKQSITFTQGKQNCTLLSNVKRKHQHKNKSQAVIDRQHHGATKPYTARLTNKKIL
jgi:hypothetical protein